MSSSPVCTLYALVAKEADIAVVFRRGPSKWWQLARWDLKKHGLEHGAWFHGTLYPRRCEVSPDGKLLGYFALGVRPFPDDWHCFFAVSKVPWVTALAAWQTMGTYTTGCRFGADNALRIVGSVDDGCLFHGRYPYPVSMAATDTRWSEQNFANEVARGWVKAGERAWGAAASVWPRRRLEYPEGRRVLARRGRRTKVRLVLVSDGVSFKRPAIEGVDVRYGVEWRDGEIEPMPWAWADWSHGGEILAATKDGRLMAMAVGDGVLEVVTEHDLSAMKPGKTKSPAWAREW